MSVGIGRGRGRLPQHVNGDVEPLRKPNVVAIGRGRSTQAQGQTKSKFLEVDLAVSDPNVEGMILFKALDDFLSVNPSDDDIQELIKKIFDTVFRVKTNTDCICKCIYLASKHKTKGDSLHMIFFTQLENKYTGVENTKESYGMSALWRFQLFFSSACQYIRNQKSEPMAELIDGLMNQCLECVQPSNAEEAKIAALTVVRCVYYMKMAKRSATQINSVVSKLRGLLHASSCAASADSNVLLWFAFGLEACCHIGNKVPDETIQYYCRLLGTEAAMFNTVPPPALNLPSQVQHNYNFTDISYILNFI